MQLHINRYEFLDRRLERINCYADLVTKLPSDVSIQKILSQTLSLQRCNPKICSTIDDGSARNNCPVSHSEPSQKSRTFGNECCQWGNKDVKLASLIHQSSHLSCAKVLRNMQLSLFSLPSFNLLQIGEALYEGETPCNICPVRIESTTISLNEKAAKTSRKKYQQCHQNS